MRRAAVRASLALFLTATLINPAPAAERATAKSATERIAFYLTRIGGPGTYPIYARLGAAYLERYRETGRAPDCPLAFPPPERKLAPEARRAAGM